MNRSKAKGTRFESEVVAFLRSRGLPAERRALAGNADKGDIAGVPGFVLECKAVRNFALSAFVDEAAVEARNAGEPGYVVILKRPGANVSRAYVITELDQWTNWMTQ